MFVLVASAIHLAWFETRVWGRALYFGLHPNFGGEIVFAAVGLAAFHSSPAVRFAAYALGLFALFQLQARASILGVAVIMIGAESPLRFQFMRAAIGVGALAAIGLCLATLATPTVSERVVKFVMEDVFFVTDPDRGLMSGFTGRSETWLLAWQELQARPITGAGLNNSGATLTGLYIHGGFFKNMAEFGAPGLLLNGAILLGVAMALLRDYRRGMFLLACAVVYFFASRNINLNIFPLLMWMAILPWAAQLSARSALSPSRPAPSLRPAIGRG
jgi:hypothetical protein